MNKFQILAAVSSFIFNCSLGLGLWLEFPPGAIEKSYPTAALLVNIHIYCVVFGLVGLSTLLSIFDRRFFKLGFMFESIYFFFWAAMAMITWIDTGIPNIGLFLLLHMAVIAMGLAFYDEITTRQAARIIKGSDALAKINEKLDSISNP